MRILYLEKSLGNYPLRKRIRFAWHDLFYFDHQNGFFEAGLYSSFENIKTMKAGQAIARGDSLKNDLDAAVVNIKTDRRPGQSAEARMLEIAENINLPLFLFCGTDKAEDIPSNECLDHYKAVFKREPFKDKDRYDLSEKNKKKIHPCILTCHIDKQAKFPFLDHFDRAKTLKDREMPYLYDVFFAGRLNRRSDWREKAWSSIKESDLKSFGGLQPRDGSSVPDELSCPRLDFLQYLRATKQAKVNLAFPGIGQFTYRHLEIWSLGSFMLCHQSLNETELPLRAKEGEHYVSFDSVDDMLNKTRYYLEHEDERERIAKAGKEMFARDYDIKRYGEFIKRIITSNEDTLH